MVSEEEVQTQALIHVKNVGPPFVEGRHSEPDPDLVEDLIKDEEDDTPPVAAVNEHLKVVRPLDREFFVSVQKYVSGMPACRAARPLPGAVANDRHDQKVLNRLFCEKKLGDDSPSEVLGHNLSELSLTISNGNGRPHEILFLPVLRNPNFFLRLSDPTSYEHKKSLFLWRTVSLIRLLILNPRRLRSVLEEMRSHAVKPINERMTKQFESKLVQAEKQEAELRAFLDEARWTMGSLAKREAHSLAEGIWNALRGVPKGMAKDVVDELRIRLKRGRIWENDPWWPHDR